MQPLVKISELVIVLSESSCSKQHLILVRRNFLFKITKINK